MLKVAEPKETPLMKQYNSIKSRYPDAILLFRVGDFYETFGEDAVRASKVLGIVLTKRANGSASHVELAGFPHHSLDAYLPRLVRAGYRVAICDQLEDPRFVKGIVKRGITELVTPGVNFNDKILNHQRNNFLGAVHFSGDGNAGLALCDISTGEFLAADGSPEYIDKLIENFQPSELLYRKSDRSHAENVIRDKSYPFALDDWAFAQDFGFEKLTRHFETSSLKGYGIEENSLAVGAAGAILYYLGETHHDRLRHITGISRVDEEAYVWLDRFTLRNLEVFKSSHENGKSLVDVLDNCASPMGSRLLRRWVSFPLKNVTAIDERLDAVEFLKNNPDFSEGLRDILKETGDLERLISRISAAKANPRELLQFSRCLVLISKIRGAMLESEAPFFKQSAELLNPCDHLQQKLSHGLSDEAPANLQKGNVIRDGVNAELDELRSLAFNSRDHLIRIQQREVQNTGISSLKVAYNSVFGYYLEVTHAHREKVPTDWIRKQTLTNAERYVTPELKIYEEKILGADEKIAALEEEIFAGLLREAGEYVQAIQVNAGVLAKTDVLCSFANNARQGNYCRPAISDSYSIDITEGRHPVIEKLLPPGTDYVSNSLVLDNEHTQIMMITGPNMSGKSALLRQTALIVLMAQAGSFVPASAAKLGITDKIFTRVGATDNISSGESTFMVEMNETASILNNLSDRSLVLLDEIGRGTSTYDGISIAWAIAEYIHNHPSSRAKTLFATHYHELNEMSSFLPRIRNFNVSVKEAGNRVIFLRKLAEGGSEHSFGIHVARMAGMPLKVLERANEILKKLEKEHEFEFSDDELEVNGKAKVAAGTKSDLQLSFFQLNDPLLQQIKEDILQTDINTLTPVEALFKAERNQKTGGWLMPFRLQINPLLFLIRYLPVRYICIRIFWILRASIRCRVNILK
jgi:DNA mismatch repair protein MutS